MNYTILLHACCAICAGYPIQKLKEEGQTPLVYFTNDNIDTKEEFNRRKEALVKLCRYMEVDYIIDEYNPDLYLDRIKGLECEPERGKRCDECIALRLEKSARFAAKNGINAFTTTLVISPHKNYDRITDIGTEIGRLYNLNYTGINFRKGDGFLKTNKISKELNLYRQNYCGCRFAKNHLKEVTEYGM